MSYRRFTVNLSPSREKALAFLMEKDGGSQSDAVNRALGVAKIVYEVQDGNDMELLVRHKETGEIERLVIII